jgi:hypothetical protein
MLAVSGPSTLWKSCNREGLPVPAEESCVAEIFAQDRKATGKTGDDHQYESCQPDECEWVLPDSGSGTDSQVVDLCVHADHGDARQRQHLSGIAPVHPPDPETLSGSPKGRTGCGVPIQGRMEVVSGMHNTSTDLDIRTCPEIQFRYEHFNGS